MIGETTAKSSEGGTKPELAYLNIDNGTEEIMKVMYTNQFGVTEQVETSHYEGLENALTCVGAMVFITTAMEYMGEYSYEAVSCVEIVYAQEIKEDANGNPYGFGEYAVFRITGSDVAISVNNNH